MAATSGAGSYTFRLPLSARLLSLVGTITIAAASLFLCGVVFVVLLNDAWIVAIVAALSAATTMLLTRYVMRDLQGKWGLRVALGIDSAEFFLPKHRSLIHATATRRVIVPYADIEAIETRVEAYPSFGMVTLQQPYVLRRKSGETLFLFEERAVATGLQSSYFGKLVGEIAARAKIEVRDLGMSEGSGGVLGVAHTQAADWAAPALPYSRQTLLFRRAFATGRLAFLLVIFAFMVRWAVSYLR